MAAAYVPPIDLIVAIDESRSISERQFDKSTQLIAKRFLGQFNAMRKKLSVGVVTIGDEPNVIEKLKEGNLQRATRAVENYNEPEGEGADFGSAVSSFPEFDGLRKRKDAARVAIIFADADVRRRQREGVKNAVKTARKAGFTIFYVALSKGVEVDVWRQNATLLTGASKGTALTKRAFVPKKSYKLSNELMMQVSEAIREDAVIQVPKPVIERKPLRFGQGGGERVVRLPDGSVELIPRGETASGAFNMDKYKWNGKIDWRRVPPSMRSRLMPFGTGMPGPTDYMPYGLPTVGRPTGLIGTASCTGTTTRYRCLDYAGADRYNSDYGTGGFSDYGSRGKMCSWGPSSPSPRPRPGHRHRRRTEARRPEYRMGHSGGPNPGPEPGYGPSRRSHREY